MGAMNDPSARLRLTGSERRELASRVTELVRRGYELRDACFAVRISITSYRNWSKLPPMTEKQKAAEKPSELPDWDGCKVHPGFE